MAELQLTKGYYSIIDAEQLPILSQYSWQCVEKDGNFYARTSLRKGKKTHCFYLHRLLTNAQKDEYVDHINGNSLDNCLSNLRICTNAQNVRNSKKRRNNKSGYKGVYFNSQLRKPWVARITFNYKGIHIGNYETPLEAGVAYNSAAKKYFGEFARINTI